jgi:hypothetical protein
MPAHNERACCNGGCSPRTVWCAFGGSAHRASLDEPTTAPIHFGVVSNSRTHLRNLHGRKREVHFGQLCGVRTTKKRK